MSNNHIHRHVPTGEAHTGGDFTITKEGAIFLDGAQLVVPHQGKTFLTDLYKMLDCLDADTYGGVFDNLEQYVESLFVEEEPAPMETTSELWHGFIVDFFPEFNYVRVWHQASPDEVYAFDPTETSDVSLADDPYAALCRRAAKDYFDSHPAPKALAFPLPDNAVFSPGSRIVDLAPGLFSTENGDVLNWAGQNYVRQETTHE